jgi:hypothetical protein
MQITQEEIKSAFGNINVLFAIIVNIISILQFRQAKQQTKDIQKINDSLTTRYLTTFPDFLPQVVTLINSTQKHLEIVVDVPGYGILSKHDEFVEYETAIKRRLSKNIPVKIVFLNKERRKESFSELFPAEGQDWDAWRNKQENQIKLHDFFAHEGDNKFDNEIDRKSFIDNTTRDQLEAALENAYQRVCTNAFRTANKVEVNEQLSFHFWISDGQSAVFTIPSFSPNDKAQGFTTSDPRLIAALTNIVERYCRNKPQPPEP